MEARRQAESFVGELGTAVGERLRAATLFGSAARGEWIDDLSDINVLVLVDSIDAALVGRAAPAVQAAVGRGITPLVMELDEWARAADVFAIEVADMQDAGVPLLGEHPAAGAELQPAKLRLQAERELRGKLLHLHAGMLLAATDRARLGSLLIRALPSFTTYLRAALRLSGQPVPRSSRDVIVAGCMLCGAQPDAFMSVWDARADRGELELSLSDPLVDSFNTAASRLAAWIDAFGRPHP